jgi:glycosyltransferase involved in cell wall biosynthesis
MILVLVGAGEEQLLAKTLSSLVSNCALDTPISVLPLEVDRSAAMEAVYQLQQSERVTVLPNEHGESVSPWIAALEFAAAHAGVDLLLVRPGIQVPAQFDSRLALAAELQPELGAVSPMADSCRLFSLLPADVNLQCSLEDVDGWLLRHSQQRNNHPLPAVFSGTVYLRAEALALLQHNIDHLRNLDVGTASHHLVRLLHERGLQAAVCDHVYVRDHFTGRPNELAAVTALADSKLIERVHPLSRLRHAVMEFASSTALSGAAAIEPLRPVQLHIAHSWGGGLDHWVMTYCKSDVERENLVLRSLGTWGSFGQRIALYDPTSMDAPLRYWDLSYPIRATATSHLEYAAILRAIIAEFRVEAIMVSSLIGHALEALTTGLPTLLIAHDYYPFCPAVVIHYDSVCTSCDLTRLTACRANNPQNRFFGNVEPIEWLSLRKRFADVASRDTVRFVVPSPSVAQHWLTLLPTLAQDRFNFVPHGVDFAPPRLKQSDFAHKLRVVVLGSLAPQKGATLLQDLVKLLSPQVEVYLVGCGEIDKDLASNPRVHVIPTYQRSELAQIMADIQPHMGMLLSVWPETFSYTLSELWLMGLPVLATRLGSFADRIKEGQTGWTCPPNPRAIAEKLNQLAQNPDRLIPLWEHLAKYEHRSMRDMVLDYHKLLPLAAFSVPRYLHGAEVTGKVSNPGPERPLYVNPTQPFSVVLAEFGRFTLERVANTPRLGPRAKQFIRWTVGMSLRIFSRITRINRVT